MRSTFTASFALFAILLLSCAAQPSTQSDATGDTPEPAAAPVQYPSVAGPVDGLQPRPNDVAVVVGIEEYAFLPDVSGARQTAYDWEDFFRDSLNIDRVYTLLDEDASREDISAQVQTARDEISGDGRLWFVFVGHGAPGPDGEDGLLVGMDARQSMRSLEARSISRSAVLSELSASATDDTVAVLDTCFSGQSPDGAPLVEGAQPVIPVQEDLDGEQGSTLVLSASRSDQLAGPLPGADRPSFSYLLLGALRGWAVDGNGDVAADDAHRFVDRQLRSVTSRRQTPQLQGPSDRVLVANATEAAPELRDLLAGRTSRHRSEQQHSTPDAESEPAPSPRPRPAQTEAPTAPTDHERRRTLYGLQFPTGGPWSLASHGTTRNDVKYLSFHGHGGRIHIERHGLDERSVDDEIHAILNDAMDVDPEQEREETEHGIPPFRGPHYSLTHDSTPYWSDDHVEIGSHTGQARSFHNYYSHTDSPERIAFYFVENDGYLWMFALHLPAGHSDSDSAVESYNEFIRSSRFHTGAPSKTSHQPRQSRSGSSAQSPVALGHGLHVVLDDLWTVTGDERIDSTIHQWTIEGYGGEIMIHRLEDKAILFDDNVDTMVESMIAGGAQFLSGEDYYKIPPHTGHLRSFHDPRTDKSIGLYFIRHDRDMWMFRSSLPEDHPDYQGWIDAYVQFLASVRLGS